MAATIARTLEGKVALVTGASSGIGRAAAFELARRGAKVVASARRGAEIDALVSEISGEGLNAKAVCADINVEADVERLVSEAIKTYGRLDVAFNNAGTEGEFSPFVDQSNATYDTIFNANVRGVFWSMKHQAKAMLAQGAGSIINNASMGGVIGFANAALYIASKHAVLGLTKTASLEWFKQGVRVNAICPGLIDTPFQDRVWKSQKAKDDVGASSVPAAWERRKRWHASSPFSRPTTRHLSREADCSRTAATRRPNCSSMSASKTSRCATDDRNWREADQDLMAGNQPTSSGSRLDRGVREHVGTGARHDLHGGDRALEKA